MLMLHHFGTGIDRSGPAISKEEGPRHSLCCLTQLEIREDQEIVSERVFMLIAHKDTVMERVVNEGSPLPKKWTRKAKIGDEDTEEVTAKVRILYPNDSERAHSRECSALDVCKKGWPACY